MMKIIIVCCGILIILCCNHLTFAQTPDWYSQIKKIKILKSNRNEVIKMFGEPNNVNDKHYISYKYDDYSLSIEFSSGLCEATKEEGWNVPEFVVTDIFIQLYKKINYQELNLKLDKLVKEEISDVPGAFIYYDYVKGESYNINSKGLLGSISLTPKKKDKHLFCESNQ